ncbi:DUF1003 domain-containing protein [Arthrobacter sp. I2-34]|uniref:DUF1003 domain-containing protein n=1 Tax=Arthrobacter hankyongi TaxID=2904801 RepID=A0ABS9L8I3_9MICC|nr:DUF1003 domain-containing protein [Arthrobacter hankyongi]MCG2622807.1 DUF1003 domain-containing protein [Arthrobacter hankyongi]
MAEPKKTGGLDTPREARARLLPRLTPNPDAFGKATEKFARFMGTPQFLVWMSVFCIVWLGWNTFGPEPLRFDSAALGFTALTLMLSLQASYAAPLLLLAQNRQDDRDKVTLQQDRQRAERNLSDTEYLTRELAALRIALREVATRDFVRSELRSVLEELLEEDRERRPARKNRKKKAGDATMSLPRVDAAPDELQDLRNASDQVAGSEP